MTALGIFPFGQPVRKVVQKDRSPKRVFVLGVYASAVHARWIGADNKIVVRALAVASEPEIFWAGKGAEKIVSRIKIPEQLGRLQPAQAQYNGPSGKTLDDSILSPLGLNREDAWLCDLVPHSCENPRQRKAIQSKYLPAAKKHDLPCPTVPPVPYLLADEKRCNAICKELDESGAETLILLGDKPIQWFLKPFDPRWERLADFVREGQPYGKTFRTDINGRQINVLPLAHPRQIGKLGLSSQLWYQRHLDWMNNRAAKVF